MYQIPENFEWDSKDQLEGWFAFIKWCKDKKVHPVEFAPAYPLFAIQKNHESNQWWAETIGEQIKMLQTEIANLKQENENLRRYLDI